MEKKKVQEKAVKGFETNRHKPTRRMQQLHFKQSGVKNKHRK